MMAQAELGFAVQFAQDAGNYMVTERKKALASRKLDRTVVTNVDVKINQDFIREVRKCFGKDVSVIGEEMSARTRGGVLWVIDPVDGTGEYVNTGIADNKRTSCIGIAMLKNGNPQLSVVYNPFRKELFVADRRNGSASLNNRRLNLQKTKMGGQEFAPGIAYDYCHWNGASIDLRFLEKLIGAPPLNSYSAINQACDVARGKSAFAVFPGDTIHDIAPSALLVELAGGKVSDTLGGPLRLHNLNRGAVYTANSHIHSSVIQHLKTNI